MTLRSTAAICAAALVAAVPMTAHADGHATEIVTSQHAFMLTKVSGELEHPWGLDWLPDGRIIVTERPGRVRIVGADGAVSDPLDGMPDLVSEFRDGLLDIAVSPDFAADQTVFLSYSQKDGAQRWTEVARAKLEGGALTGMQVIFAAGVRTEKDQGFGSRIRFDGDGNLLVTIGDHAIAAQAQDGSNTLGSIIRLTPQGKPVNGNPGGALHPAILAYGFKNPQGLTVSPADGTVWAVDHGGVGGGEINRVVAGGNYGWPQHTYSGGDGPRADPRSGFTEPAFTWGAAPTVALSGLEIYSGDDFPGWSGDLFAGSLTQEALIRVMLDDSGHVTGTEHVVAEEIGRIREVRQGPDGRLYLLNDEPDGAIYRIDPRN